MSDFMRSLPDFQFEQNLMAQGAARVAGVDEVGRGPLAGPVTAAAVVLNPADWPEGLADSKTLTAKRREVLSDLIWQMADVSVAHASVEEIDQINILQASHLAMCRAIAGLQHPPAHVLIDGNLVPKALVIPATPVIKGDGRCVSIAAASIVAKVVRDRIMVDLAQQHPHYGWERNAGYPTAQHREGLKSHGVTPHHRRSFRTVHNML